MTDYTPTTEEIRTGYSTATYDDSKAKAEFDRWLAQVQIQAWENGFQAQEWRRNPYRLGETE